MTYSWLLARFSLLPLSSGEVTGFIPLWLLPEPSIGRGRYRAFKQLGGDDNARLKAITHL